MWATIGSMEPSRRCDLERIPSLNKKFYIPNNAVLIVADFKNDQAKEWIQKYFGP
jgi:predicted Zn-dependent peptidase